MSIPSSISGLQLWFDASDQNSYTLSGSNITQLKDKSGLGNNTSTYSGTQPTFATNVINGLPVFNMVSGGFFGNISITVPTLTVFMIAIITQNSINFNRLIDFDDGLGGDNGSSVGKTVITFAPIALYRGANANSGITTLNTPYLVTCYFTGTNAFLGVNAIYNSFTSFGSFAINKYGIGLNFNTGGGGNCKYGEVLVFNTSLSTSDRQTMEGYLAWKWGTNASLPTGHPYYNSKPYRSYPNSVISPITPPKIVGLQLWLDSHNYDSLTFDSSGNVSQWNDTSGFGRNATKYSNVAANVGYSATGFNNLPAIQYSISGQGLSTPMPAGTLSTGSSFFVVFKSNGLGGGPISMSTLGEVGSPFNMNFNARYVGNGLANSSASSINFGANLNNNILSFTIKLGLYDEYFNGISVLRFSPSSYGQSINNFYIGLWSSKGALFSGSISEILVYNSVLSTENRQIIEGYLAWKWNMVSSLPKNHPYYTHTPSFLIPNWNVYPYYSNAFVQTYIKDFVDISGNLVVRNANLNVLNGDISFNGSMYLQTSINPNSITTVNITATNNLFLNGKNIYATINGNLVLGNTITSQNLLVANSITMNGNLYISGSLSVPNGNIYLGNSLTYPLTYMQNTNNANFGGLNKPLLVDTTNGVTIAGYLAGNSLISSTNPDKILIGSNALNYHNTDYTVAVGYNTLNIYGNTSQNGGNYLTAIGANAGSIMLDTSAVRIVQTGQYNTFIGANTGIDSSANSWNYSTAVGAGAIITANNQVTLGTSSGIIYCPNKIVIGYGSPGTSYFFVNGNSFFTGDITSNNYYLTSIANTWGFSLTQTASGDLSYIVSNMGSGFSHCAEYIGAFSANSYFAIDCSFSTNTADPSNVLYVPNNAILNSVYIQSKTNVTANTTINVTKNNITYPVSPLQVSGTQLWLDAADYSSLVLGTGNILTQWNDKSGYGRHAVQSNNSNLTNVVYNAIELNGLPTINYKVGSQGTYSNVSAGTFSSGMTLFMVFKPTSGYLLWFTRSSQIIGYGNPAPFNMVQGRRDIGNGAGVQYLNSSYIPQNNFNIPVMLSVTLSTTKYNEYLNGTNIVFDATLLYYRDNGIYVNLGTIDIPTSISISEMVLYNSALSTTDRQYVEGYLAWKWRINTSLPISHPYYNSPAISGGQISTIIPSGQNKGNNISSSITFSQGDFLNVNFGASGGGGSIYRVSMLFNYYTGPPGLLLNVVANITSNTTATVMWSVPLYNGGSPIIGYTITSYPGNIVINVNESTTTANFTGLTTGTTYYFGIVAKNNVFNSAIVLSNNVIPSIMPLISALKCCYSARKVVSTYTGPVFRLRNSGTGVTQDFYSDIIQSYLTTGANNTGTTFSSWIGANTAYVVTWYDQSPNALHATNTTNNTTQPNISLQNRKYILQFQQANSVGLIIPTQQVSNTIFAHYYNTIANYATLISTEQDYGMRFTSSNGIGINGDSNEGDWFFSASGTKLSYNNGVSATSVLLNSWNLLTLSVQTTGRPAVGFTRIGMPALNGNVRMMNGYISEIMLHNTQAVASDMTSYYNNRLF